MKAFSDRPVLRIVLLGALAAAFALAGCGRKGPLDPPPGASLAGEPQANMPELMSNKRAAPIGGQTQAGNPGVGPDGQPLAPKGPKKTIPLDVLLN
ncbi:MAG: LPS translocon maturation chaperone LptM [Pseudolabrys sp.]